MTQDGWRTVKLGDVARQVSVHTQDPLVEGLTRYVGLEHLDPEHLRVGRWGDVSDGTTFTKRFEPGQLLFARRRAYQRKAAVADFAGVCSGDMIVIEADSKRLLPELLPYIAHSDRFLELALKTSAGSLSPRTKWNDLRQYEFRLPPLGHQRHVLKLVGEARSAATAASKVVDQSEALFKAVVTESTRVAESNLVPLSEVAQVRMGLQLSPARRRGTDPRPYLRAANVRQGWIDTSDVLKMDFSADEWVKFSLRSGDILIVEGGEARDVGMSAIVTKDTAHGYSFQNTLIRIRPEPGVDPQTLHHLLYGFRLLGRFAHMAQGTKIKHIGASRVASMRVPDPRSAWTEDEADLVNQLLRVAGDARRNLRTSSAVAKQLLRDLMGVAG